MDLDAAQNVDRKATHVRRYRESDIPHVTKYMMQELPKLPQYAHIVPSADKIRFLLQTNLKTEQSFLIQMLCDSHTDIPVGGSAAYCMPILFSDDVHTMDLFLFVHPKWRTLLNVIKMIDAYKKWAKRRGAKIIGCAHTSGYRSDAMDMLLLRQGFERIGFMYHLKQSEM